MIPALTGILAPHGLATSFDSIATVALTGNQATISFTSIPNTYKHLQIRAQAFQNLGNDWRGVTMRFNSDSGANYTFHILSGSGSSVSASGGGGYTGIYPIVAGWNSYNAAGVAVIDILDYASTNKNKTIRSMSGIARNTTPEAVEFISGAWLNTNAITDITFTVNADYFTAGTNFALYGIKG